MMKLLYTIFFSLLILTLANSQITISEIMYNPPEGGQDSLEYIELHNAGDAPVSLMNYSFRQGVEHVFGDTTVNAGGYLVLVVNSVSFQAAMGIEAMQWTGGALSNGGEFIVLIDEAGMVVDSVDYDDNDPWPSDNEGTDGGGASIEFCADAGDNNIGESWRASTNDLGVMIDGISVKGTPGFANVADCSAPVPDVTVVSTNNIFTPADITINVGETVLFRNEEGFHNANGSLDVFPDNPEGFTSGALSSDPWEYQFTFTQEGVYNYQCDAHVSVGMVGTVTVMGMDTMPSLAEVSAVDAEGVLIRDGDSVTVGGIVYGVNLRPGGLQFTIIDETNEGLAVFSASDDLGYIVAEGDEVFISGELSQFNGLAQINPTSVDLLSRNNNLVSPRVITSFEESMESSLVKLENVYVVDSTEWTGSGSGFNVDVTNGMDTFAIRIDADVVDLYTGSYPRDTFDITGIGGQFDNSAPFTSGYQLLPRYIADVDPYNSGTGSEYEAVTIAEITTNDENGNAASEGRKVEIVGVTYGVNLRPGGYQFTIIDEGNDGIGLFQGDQEGFDYDYQEGDVVRIRGEVSQFNGLTQIAPDEITLLSSGNDLIEPTVVTDLDESTESQFIIIESATVLDAAQWEADGGSFNVDIMTSSGGTYTMRIDSDTDAADQMLPGMNLQITGIGGQFDNSEPYDDGYQILPRSIADVVPVSSVTDQVLADHLVEIYPNPATQWVRFEADLEILRIVVFDLSGRQVKVQRANTQNMDISDLESGLYIVNFNLDSGIVQKKLIKN